MSMNPNALENPIISLASWFDTPPGRYARAWEQMRLNELTADIFGYNASLRYIGRQSHAQPLDH
jgi:hypothetical protein